MSAEVRRRPRRVLVAKPGLDGHERGAHVVARGLRDAGMEVIYTGIRQTSEMIAATAVQEDVDCVGLSIMSGSHLELVEDVQAALTAQGAANVRLIVGGIIPDEDRELLRERGVWAVFGPGSSLTEIATAIERLPPRGVEHLTEGQQ